MTTTKVNNKIVCKNTAAYWRYFGYRISETSGFHPACKTTGQLTDIKFSTWEASKNNLFSTINPQDFWKTEVTRIS